MVEMGDWNFGDITDSKVKETKHSFGFRRSFPSIPIIYDWDEQEEKLVDSHGRGRTRSPENYGVGGVFCSRSE